MTTIKAGTRLRWIQRNEFSGEIVRTVDCVAHGEPFEVKRSGWESRWVVRLTCNRLASVEDLQPIETQLPVSVVKDTKPATQNTERNNEEPTYAKKSIQSQLPNAISTQSASEGSKRFAERPGNQSKTHSRPHTVSAGRSNDDDRQISGRSERRECNVLAIDFLNVLVRAYHAGKPSETHAVRSLFQTVANAIRHLRPERIVFAMDGGHVHRTALLPTYKAHRPPSEPLLVSQRELAEKALAIAGFQAVRVIDFEADDIIASVATANTGTVICSSDKDLLALCGIARVYHPWGAGEFVTAESKLNLPAGQITDYLALCGDASDGIPGVKGIGPKTALELLTEFDSLEGILAAATMGQIKGAKGVTLKERRDEALKSRQLVELKTSLPLPQMQPWTPPIGYQEKLQAMGLGSVAAILDALLTMPAVENAPAESPKLVTPPAAKKTKSLFDDDEERPQACDVALSAGTGKPERAKAESVDRVQPDNESGSESEKLNRPVTSTNSAEGHGNARTQQSLVTRFEMDIECLMVLADDVRWSTPEATAVTCWHAGRECRMREINNPWKPESFRFVAWNQGFQGVPLSVEL